MASQDQAQTDTSCSPHQKKKFFSALMGLLLFCLMLFFTIFSKISLVNLTNQLRLLTRINDSNATEDYDYFEQLSNENRDQAVTVYWCILLVLMVPNLVTFLRSFIIGVICKQSSENHPWPNVRPLIIVSLFYPHDNFFL